MLINLGIAAGPILFPLTMLFHWSMMVVVFTLFLAVGILGAINLTCTVETKAGATCSYTFKNYYDIHPPWYAYITWWIGGLISVPFLPDPIAQGLCMFVMTVTWVLWLLADIISAQYKRHKNNRNR